MDAIKQLQNVKIDPELEKRIKRIGIIVVAVVVPLALVDIMVLRGEVVLRKSGIRFTESESVTLQLPVRHPGDKYTVRFDTNKREIALGWTIVAPEGDTVEDDSEMFRHDGARRFSFRPDTEGDYVLTVRREHRSGGILGSGTRDSVTVEVLVHDRQILGPLFEW